MSASKNLVIFEAAGDACRQARLRSAKACQAYNNMPEDAYEWTKKVSRQKRKESEMKLNELDCRCSTITSLVVCLYIYLTTNIEEHIITYKIIGKLNRGISVVDTVRILKGDSVTEDDIFKATVLGWLIEFVSQDKNVVSRERKRLMRLQLQAFFLVSDDIMDASITRRGQPCWYKSEGVGMVAINDAFILESCIYIFLKKYFKKTNYYIELVELFHEVTFQTELGQLCDLITAPEDHVDLSKFSIKK